MIIQAQLSDNINPGKPFVRIYFCFEPFSYDSETPFTAPDMVTIINKWIHGGNHAASLKGLCTDINNCYFGEHEVTKFAKMRDGEQWEDFEWSLIQILDFKDDPIEGATFITKYHRDNLPMLIAKFG